MIAIRYIRQYLLRHPLKVAVAMTLAVLLSSCNKGFSDIEQLTSSEVSFIPKGVSLEDGGLTKASPDVTVSLDGTGFYASAVKGSAGSDVEAWTNVHFVKSGSDFKGGKYWPVSDPSYRFFAANVPLTYTSGGATISASNDVDVVCAYKSNPTYGARNTLQFDHVFARISSVKVTAASPYNISNVTIWIVDPKTGGTYNLYTGNGHNDGAGWSSLTPAGSSQTTLYSNAGVISSGSSNTGTDNNLFLVPGDYQLKASWSACVDDYSQSYTTRTSIGNISVQGGKVNSIECLLSGDATELVFNVVFAAWSNLSVNAGLFPVEPDYALPGEFSVDTNKKVKFSKGNLQAVIGTGISDYRATASLWNFAEHQYDIIGNAAGNTSFAVGTTVDLFGWVGESADYDTYGLCTNTEVNNAYYGTNVSDALKTDWGSISGIETWIGSDWRTLTTTEWNYLFTQRTNASSLYGQCQITTASGTVTGMLILPDNWTRPSNCMVSPGIGVFDRETYSSTAASGVSNAWCDMEAAGAVFFPAAGYRNGVGVNLVGSGGHYWSSSVSNEIDAYGVCFYSGRLSPRNLNSRFNGFSVRLVLDSN